DAELAVAVMSAAAPCVDGKAEAARSRARLLSAWTPVFLPADQVSSHEQLVMVDLRARSDQIQVLQHEIHWVHVELGRGIFQRAHGDQAALRMVGRTPRACRTNVGGDSGMLLALIGDVGENVRHGRSAASARTSGAPRLRLPSSDGAIFFGGNFHLGE